jgi:hypothetical protein
MIIYILQMSDGRRLSKDLNWISDLDNSDLYTADHKDMALNKLVELNAKDISLRARVVCCEVNAEGKIIESTQPSAAA